MQGRGRTQSPGYLSPSVASGVLVWPETPRRSPVCHLENLRDSGERMGLSPEGDSA